MNKNILPPETLFDSQKYGFSQVVIADAGRLVFISGQVAWDEQEKIVGKQDLKLQVEKSLQNLRSAIQAAGGTMENIVMLRIYMVHLKKEDASIIGKALVEAFGTNNPPASTWLSVDGVGQ